MKREKTERRARRARVRVVGIKVQIKVEQKLGISELFYSQQHIRPAGSAATSGQCKPP